MAGPMNRMAQTSDDTGLPGRPSTGVPPIRPNISGLPGFMAMRQKSTSRPASPSTDCTRSRSPTETPPMVTRASAPRDPSASARIEDSSSGAMPRSMASPPLAATSAVSAGPLELTIWLGPMGSPGRTTSSPVARSAMRGLRATISQGWFIAAARPMSRAVSRRPARIITSPSRKSMPASRMCCPLGVLSSIRTVSPSRVVSSWMTMASAPAGTGPPVKIRTASPAATVPS